MKKITALFMLLSIFLLSACPVRNPYYMEEYTLQDSYVEMFKGKEIPRDVK